MRRGSERKGSEMKGEYRRECVKEREKEGKEE